MLVAVTGGTGFLGAHAVAELARRGHRVRLLARTPRAVIAAPDAEVVAGDVTDRSAVARLVSGADAVLHAAGLYTFDSRRRQELSRVNELGTEVVLDAARRAGVGRTVHVSTFGALLPAAGERVGVDAPVGRPREAYLASKAAAEVLARRHQAEGAPVTITYPPALLGPHDPRLGDQNARLRDLLRGLMPIWPAGGLPIGDVRDAAAQHADLLTGPAPSRVFGPGHFVPTREYLAAVRTATGRRLPAVFLPPRAMFGVGRLADLLQRAWPWPLPAQYGAIYVCAVAVPPDAGPAPARPLADTVRDTVSWLHSAGLLTGHQAGTATAPTPAGPERTGPIGKVLP